MATGGLSASGEEGSIVGTAGTGAAETTAMAKAVLFGQISAYDRDNIQDTHLHHMAH